MTDLGEEKRIQPRDSSLRAPYPDAQQTTSKAEHEGYDSDSSKWSLASMSSLRFPPSEDSHDENMTQKTRTTTSTRGTERQRSVVCAGKSKGIPLPTPTLTQQDIDLSDETISSTKSHITIEEEVKPVEPTSPQVYLMAADRSRLSQLGFQYRYIFAPPVQDFQKSTKYYQQAADIGCPDALVALAVANLFGIGVRVSYSNARKLLRRAILQGSVDALEIRALCWMDGTFDNQRSYASCLNLITMGIARNSPACLLWAGFCFEIGLGTDPDADTAKQAYLAASDSPSLRSIVTSSFPGALTARDPWMLLKIALFLLHADCSHANRGQAMDCLKQAAVFGLKDAQVYLGICLIKGTWLAKDMFTAWYWLGKASQEPCPHPVACRLLHTQK